ncbi:MAG: PSD1 domain-containing protein [Candidatus Solibacter usitatus]|nr:PSD1 domain-containing protein [Candidatus Solibacter usitatus]
MRTALFTSLLAIALNAAPVDFTKEIAPILARSCAACHAGKLQNSDFSVENAAAVMRGGKRHGKAVIGGHPEQSPLMKMVRGDLSPKMPMGGALAKTDIDKLEAWIRSLPSEGAAKKMEWRWPFEKPVKPAVPEVKNASWARNPIDAFVLSRLESSQLRPAPEADRRTLARRVYFDLIGLPPSPEEMRSFLADNAVDAYARLIDRLLADPRYGERWGRHWLDLARYGETSGLEGDGAIGNAWRYRDWVIEAMNQDMPYDRFVMAQLAGADEHSKTRNNYQPDIQGHIPLGFLRVAPWDRSNLVAGEVRQNYLSEVTTTVGSVFLGLSVGCARCHDHKYDPIPQRDYYRLQAFFQAIQVENADVPYKDPDFKKRADAAIRDLQAKLRDGAERVELNKIEADALKRLIAARKEGSKGKEITKDDLRLEMKRGEKSFFTSAERRRHADLLEDANRTQDPEEKSAIDAYEAAHLPRLKAHYAPGIDAAARFDSLGVEEARAELGRGSSKIFSAAERDRFAQLNEHMDVLRRRLGRWQTNALTVKNVPGPPAGPDIAPTRILIRGDYRQPGEAVEPGFLTCFTGKAEPVEIEQDRYRQYPTRGYRITLARWIASADNPLTARVMVNRIWQQHFGRGIVATASDFGVNGERPTHPELLDWLAHRFVEEKWSIKAMHRLLLTSATYRQSAENPAAQAAQSDPENKLLWKAARRRLEAEEIRDSVLAVSGRLNPERFGPSVFPPLPADLADFARYGRGGGAMWEPNEKEEDARRRSVYIFHRRSLPLPMMAAFDAPVFSESCERRSVTTTPLQALSMMNGYLIQDEAAQLAKRVEAAAGANREAQIEAAFAHALQRKPTQAEREKLTGVALDAICRILFNTNEFLYVD